MAVLGGPAASPQCAADAPSEAWLGQRLTTWRIGLRVFGRFGRSLAGCASRVGSVGGVVDGRAQPAERLPRAPLVWVDGDGGGVELQQHPVDGGEQCGVEFPQSLPAARVPDEYVFKPVAAASQGCQRAGQLDVLLRGRARGAAVCAPAERPEHPRHVGHEHRGAAPHLRGVIGVVLHAGTPLRGVVHGAEEGAH